MAGVHKPRDVKSRNMCWLTTVNSPAKTRRLYILEVYGSKHSLFPKICDVDAVGIGAINKELRKPCVAMLAFNVTQSQRSEGVTFHMSYCNCPFEAGDPS